MSTCIHGALLTECCDDCGIAIPAPTAQGDAEVPAEPKLIQCPTCEGCGSIEKSGGFTCDCCGRNTEMRVDGKWCNECAGSHKSAPSISEQGEMLLRSWAACFRPARPSDWETIAANLILDTDRYLAEVALNKSPRESHI